MSDAIWHKTPTLDDLHARQNGTLGDHLGICFVGVEKNALVASMTIDDQLKQPAGIMHGGINCVLAETVGSTAANFCVDRDQYLCVGLEINTNHIGQVRGGKILATATPFHIGRTTQVWHIEIKDEQDRLISINRLTMAVLKR